MFPLWEQVVKKVTLKISQQTKTLLVRNTCTKVVWESYLEGKFWQRWYELIKNVNKSNKNTYQVNIFQR